MLISFPPRQDWIYGIADGVFVTDPEMLHDRRPAEPVMIEWPGGSQTLTTSVTITAERSAELVPRMAWLLGSDLPVGLRVELRGKRQSDSGFDYALGGNSLTQRLVRMDDGSVGCFWALAAGLDPVLGYGLALYNDSNSAVAIAAEAEHIIGQLVVCDALEVLHDDGANVTYTRGGTSRRTLGGQVSRVARPGWRTWRIRGTAEPREQAWGAGVSGSDWLRLLAALNADPFCGVAPYWTDPEELQRTAIFGEIDGLGVDGIAGPFKQLQEMTLNEIPAA